MWEEKKKETGRITINRELKNTEHLKNDNKVDVICFFVFPLLIYFSICRCFFFAVHMILLKFSGV